MQSTSLGLVEVSTSADVRAVDGALVIDFSEDTAEPEIHLNGLKLRGRSPAELREAIAAHHRSQPDRVFSVRYDVAVEGPRLVITQDPAVDGADGDGSLTGADAVAAAERAGRMVADGKAWPSAVGPLAHNDREALDLLTPDGVWDGPLVVSMPRTGSTLMGLLFLFAHDPRAASGYRFDRYVHEPVAPVYWRGDRVGAIADFVDRPLGHRDVVQESAYQFAHPDLARWFLERARTPIVFTIRHPQLAWPSRWRVMLAQMLADDPDDPDADVARAALDDGDFSSLGHYLTQRVRPADNGFRALMACIDMCVREEIDFVIIDNTDFRAHPEKTLRGLTHRLAIEFDPAMTEWQNLDRVRNRVVMSDLALGEEYEWYYARTLRSDRGILPETHEPVDVSRFPGELRGLGGAHLSIHEAVTWYHMLRSRPEALG